jgi:hypothetical protein
MKYDLYYNIGYKNGLKIIYIFIIFKLKKLKNIHQNQIFFKWLEVEIELVFFINIKLINEPNALNA